MILVSGAYHVVALVVLAAGAAKIAAPDPFARLLSSLGSLPALGSLRAASQQSLQRVTWMIGAAELALGAVAVIYGGRVVAAVIAVLYLAFAFAVLAARHVGAESCGCFGSLSTPPGWHHVLIDVVAAAVAAAAAISDHAVAVGDAMSGRWFGGAGYVGSVIVAAVLVIVLTAAGRRT